MAKLKKVYDFSDLYSGAFKYEYDVVVFFFKENEVVKFKQIKAIGHIWCPEEVFKRVNVLLKGVIQGKFGILMKGRWLTAKTFSEEYNIFNREYITQNWQYPVNEIDLKNKTVTFIDNDDEGTIVKFLDIPKRFDLETPMRFRA